MATRIAVLWTIVLSLCLLPGTAFGQTDADVATARSLGIDAGKDMKAGKHAAAADKYKRAYTLFHAPSLLVGLARAYAKLGRYVEAREAYKKAIRFKLGDDASKGFKRAVANAKSELPAVDAKICWVVINVTGPESPSVTLDGQPVSAASLGVRRAVDPGEHLLVAKGEGFGSDQRRFSIASGGSQELTLVLEALPEGAISAEPAASGNDSAKDGKAKPESGADAGSLQRTLGWVGIGVGGAGVVLGAITGGMALGKHGDLSDACGPSGACPASAQDTLDGYRTLGTVSTIGFIAGGVLAAAGTVALLTAPTASDGALAAQLNVGLGRVGLSLRF